MDIDRDSRVTFTEFKRIFSSVTGGSFFSNQNPSTANSNNFLKNSNSNNLLYSYNNNGRKLDFSNTVGKQSSSFGALTRKSPLKASLASNASKTRKADAFINSVAAADKNDNNDFDYNCRDKSPLKEKTENVLSRSIERFCRSPYGKYAELTKSVGRAENLGKQVNEYEINYEINNNNKNYNINNKLNEIYNNDFDNNLNENEIKNNNLLYSSTFKSTNNNNNFNSTANTNAFSNLNMLSSSASNFEGSPNRAEFSPIVSYEEENFNSYLKEMLELENEIESAKFDLIIKADFNIEDAFRIFELSGRGYLTELDIKYGMNSLDIYPSKEEITLLVKKYDMTNEGILK